MSKQWVLTGTIDPSKLEGVVSGKFGASVMDVAYSRLLKRWIWVYPGGEEQIAEPTMLLVEQEWAAKNRCLNPIKIEKSLDIRRKKAQQLLLFE